MRLCLVATLALAACSNQPVATQCKAHSDCAASEVCTDGACVVGTRCSGDGDCKRTEHCVSGACAAYKTCTVAGDCLRTETCQGGFCVTGTAPDAGASGVDAGGFDAGRPDAGATGPRDAGSCTPTATSETSCGDGIDDDCNGLTDCADPACAGQSCGGAGTCSTGGTCNGGACTGGTLKPANTVCRPAADCSVEATCNGSSPSCPALALLPSGTPCGAAAQICEKASTCDGKSAVCPPITLKKDEVCRPAATVCDVEEKCDGAKSSCPADAFQPAGLVCGSGGLICDGTGSCTAGCTISGTYYNPKTINPVNACQTCQPTIGTGAWSAAPNGVPPQGCAAACCLSTQVCLGGQCTTGCFVDGNYYGTSTVNPNNVCQVCQPSIALASWTASAGKSCGSNGLICDDLGGCAAGCWIGNNFYPSGARPSSNACLSCQPTVKTDDWSPLPDGTVPPSGCSAGVCHLGACAHGCWIGGQYYAVNAQGSGNCGICTPSNDPLNWTPIPAGQACAAGQYCDGAGNCSANSCVIGGQSHQAGTLNPSNGCQSCQPAQSTVAWSNINNRVPPAGCTTACCASSQVCSNGTCTSGCIYAGVFYAPNALNPADHCQSCQPSLTVTGWSNVNDGVPPLSCKSACCAQGQVCLTGTCTPGCYISGVYHPAGVLNPGDNCQICSPTASITAWTTMGTDCRPGVVTSQSCGKCGGQSMTCTSTCHWPGWSACVDPGYRGCCDNHGNNCTCCL